MMLPVSLPRRHVSGRSSALTSVLASTPETLAAGDDSGSIVDAGALGMIPL